MMNLRASLVHQDFVSRDLVSMGSRTAIRTGHPVSLEQVELRVHARDGVAVSAVTDDLAVELERRGDVLVGVVPAGAHYALLADGPGADPQRSLVDPEAVEVWFPPGHRRDAARAGAGPNHDVAPRAVAGVWVRRGASRTTSHPLVVYEVHARGWTRRRDHPAAGTFRAAIDDLDRLAALGVSVVELLPVHQFDPDEGNYWGYMPLVFGAVHGQYAAGGDAAAELAELIAAAHERDLEVWLDVVFNHTTEEDAAGPTYNLRGLDADGYYVAGGRADAAAVDETGTGNTIDASSPATQRLVVLALERFADLGVDGFRFDLASVLSRDPAFVRAIGDWADRRAVRLVAEPWDLTRYQVGRAFPDDRWMQWNDRFRDDMRGFLRGEPGLVPSVVQRLQGSPDLFERPGTSVNFLTAHDGFTMYDLVAYDRKHNDANGWGGRDGTDDNRSWNCGWEGDDGVPDEVLALRHRQLRNAMCLLLLSNGIPMFVAGDEFARTQRGNNNPYNQDNEISWIDWGRADEYGDLTRFVSRLLALRRAEPVLAETAWWGERVRWFGVDGALDDSHESRALAWSVGGLYVMANMWWEPLRFTVQTSPPLGTWSIVIDTADRRSGAVDASGMVEVGPRSIVVMVAR